MVATTITELQHMQCHARSSPSTYKCLPATMYIFNGFSYKVANLSMRNVQISTNTSAGTVCSAKNSKSEYTMYTTSRYDADASFA